VAALVSTQQAKDHLRLTDDTDILDLKLKCEQATAMVLNYLERAADDSSPAWTAETDPSTDPELAIVKAAILTLLGDMYRFRGDDEEPSHTSAHDLPPRVARTLRLLKDPTLA
jgi:hypothetical protein